MKFNKTLFLLIIAFFLVACEDSLKNLKPRFPVQQARSTKRGFGFNNIHQNDIFSLSEGCVWGYNWGPDLNYIIADPFQNFEMDFCPMGWSGLNESGITRVRNYVAMYPKTKYLLGLNEPNLTDQANCTPAQAASRWQQYVDLSKELNLKLISPAMNYGTLAGYQDPIKWLDEFFALVDINDIHGIAIHAYMNSASGMKGFIDRFRKYGKPIWLTEFACSFNPVPSVTSQIALMNDICNYMEADPLIERYAWFMLRGGPADVNNALADRQNPPQLTQLGVLYNVLSSQDKNIWYVENQTIEAEKYTSINSAENVGQAGLQQTPTIRVTTDAEGGGFDVTNFKPDMWLEYQIDAPGKGVYKFSMRYSVAFDSEMNILVDGVKKQTLKLNRSADTSTSWVTLTDDLKLEKGKHTLRLVLTEGSGAINWLKFSLP